MKLSISTPMHVQHIKYELLRQKDLQLPTKTCKDPQRQAKNSKNHIPSTNNSQGNSSELEKLGSQQAPNQSDAQDKHTKHCEQGLYLVETS